MDNYHKRQNQKTKLLEQVHVKTQKVNIKKWDHGGSWHCENLPDREASLPMIEIYSLSGSRAYVVQPIHLPVVNYGK